MFTASRILYGLGLRGLAPRWVSYCTKSGVPIAALGVCVCGPVDRRSGLTLTDYISVLLPLASLHGRQEWILQSLYVSSLTKGYQFGWFLTDLVKQLVHRYLDAWDLHRLVDYQPDLP